MIQKIKNLITIILFALVCYGFSAAIIFAPKKEYSMTERRALKKAPLPSSDSLLSGKFMSDFDDFTLDQFPLRDSFRKIKANFSKNVLLKKDNHGLYLKNGYLSKIEYPANFDKIQKNLTKISNINTQYLKNTNCNIFYSIIPDKNYFLAQNDFPKMDYYALLQKVQENLSFAKYINIFPLLSLQNFYKTDQHWKQEDLLPIAQKLTEEMGSKNKIKNPTLNKLENPFYGTYYGQAALSVLPDEIYYYTNPTMENATVTSYNTGSPQNAQIYNMKKAQGRDPYEMFLEGSNPLITIQNPSATTEKELIIFRDSFASSLSPLFIDSYAKITLVDLRYIQSSMLKNFIEFTNQDVLFLYSTLILNN